MKSYLVAAIRPWHRHVFDEVVSKWPERWELVTTRDELTLERIDALHPRYIFFPHWSWIVPPEVLTASECVCFHETDLPFGRGGSPIQNLIARGHESTVITAFRMVEQLDAGPVYEKAPLSLHGGAEEVYLRAAYTMAAMMRRIADTEPVPTPQHGEPVEFARRTPAQSEIDAAASVQQMFDHIRMLDAAEYPRAFATIGDWHLEFTNAVLRTGAIEAHVTMRRRAAE